MWLCGKRFVLIQPLSPWKLLHRSENQGIILDSGLPFQSHVVQITKLPFNIRTKVRGLMSQADAEKLVHAFMLLVLKNVVG